MNFDLLAKLNIIYYKSVTFFKKIKIVHIFLCLYLKYMCFVGISSLKTVGDGLENASFLVRIANKASLHSKEALFGVKRSLVCEAKKPCLETGWGVVFVEGRIVLGDNGLCGYSTSMVIAALLIVTFFHSLKKSRPRRP